METKKKPNNPGHQNMNKIIDLSVGINHSGILRGFPYFSPPFVGRCNLPRKMFFSIHPMSPASLPLALQRLKFHPPTLARACRYLFEGFFLTAKNHMEEFEVNMV